MLQKTRKNRVYFPFLGFPAFETTKSSFSLERTFCKGGDVSKMPRYQPADLLTTRNVGANKRRTLLSTPAGGIEIATPNNVASREEYDDFCSGLTPSDGVLGEPILAEDVVLTPPIFRCMEKKGHIRKVPYNAHFMATDNAEKRLEECIQFAQNPNFVETHDVQSSDRTGYFRLDKGYEGDGYRVLPNKTTIFPTVYYVTVDGFVIACTRAYVSPGTAEQLLQAGTGDILGRRFKSTCRGRSYQYFVRRYSVMRSSVSTHNAKRTFLGVDCSMSSQQANIDLGALMLVSFVGPRPEKGMKYVVQHDDESWNNAISCLRWIPRAENNMKENLDPNAAEKRAKYVTGTVMEIDESTLDTDEWLEHPTLPIMINLGGNHVYHHGMQKFLTIRHTKWILRDWEEQSVTVDRCSKGLPKLVLECKLGRELQTKSGETVEHIDSDRTNNHVDNLIPRHRLFQANAKKKHKDPTTSKMLGIAKCKDTDRYYAEVQVYTPDDKTASVQKRKYFSAFQYGSLEKAKEAAIAYRFKHTLGVDGMNWD